MIRVTVQGAKITGMSLVERVASVTIIFRVFNPTDKLLTLRSLTYGIHKDGKKVADGKIDAKLKINPHSSEYVFSAVQLPLFWFFARSLLELKDRGHMVLDVVGTADVDDAQTKFETIWKIGE